MIRRRFPTLLILAFLQAVNVIGGQVMTCLQRQFLLRHMANLSDSPNLRPRCPKLLGLDVRHVVIRHVRSVPFHAFYGTKPIIAYK